MTMMIQWEGDEKRGRGWEEGDRGGGRRVIEGVGGG